MTPTAALVQSIQDHLNLYLYSNAIALAEQLYAVEPNNDSLHVLAECFIKSGDSCSAYRLLKHSYPFRTDAGHKLTYLLGVACGLANRHSECLGYMRSIPLPSLAQSLSDRDRVTAAAVLHWIATSESKLGSPKATSFWSSAVALNPSLISSFESSVVFGGGEVGALTRPYTTPMPTTAVDRGAQRHQDTTTAPGCSSVQQLEEVRAFLAPTACIIANLNTYNCAAAYAAVSGKGFGHRCSAASDGPSPSYWASLVKAQCCFNISDHENAVRYFADAMRTDPWRLNDTAWIAYSTSLWHLQDAHTLGTLAQTLLAELGPSPIACAVAGNYYSRLRDQKSAVQMLTRAVSSDNCPPSVLAPALTLLGYEELGGGKHAKASEQFSSALRAHPRAFMAMAGLGETELRKGNVKAAREEFYKALTINPLPSVMQRYAATFHRREANGEELRTAIQLYDEILIKQPKYPLARLRKAAALLQLGDPQAALDEVETLLQADSAGEAEVWLTRGRCCARLGDKQGAISSLNKAIDLDTRVANEAKALLEDLQQ